MAVRNAQTKKKIAELSPKTEEEKRKQKLVVIAGVGAMIITTLAFVFG